MDLISQILTPERTVFRVEVNSKKRLLEAAADLIHKEQETLPVNEVLCSLVAREKLGSTGLGDGIAVPHCRLEGVTEATGLLLTLRDPIDFDSPDGQPVDLAFVLLVPDEATQQHLDILAALARLFTNPDFCAQLRGATDAADLYYTATHWSERLAS